MRAFKVKDWFVFGEWFDIFWFHSCYVAGLTTTIRDHLGYGLSQLVVEQDDVLEQTMAQVETFL